jgi:hypothetical protein
MPLLLAIHFAIAVVAAVAFATFVQATAWYPDWIEIRVSFGMMGAIFHSTDALLLADYLIEHVTRRPPDHLMIEWYCGETEQSKAAIGNRKHMTFRCDAMMLVCLALPCEAAFVTRLPLVPLVLLLSLLLSLSRCVVPRCSACRVSVPACCTHCTGTICFVTRDKSPRCGRGSCASLRAVIPN